MSTMDGDESVIEKEPAQASKSSYLKERLSQPIVCKNAFAHIRYATIGNVEYVNCHPYTKKDITGRRWTQIHNGTIFDFAPANKYTKIQKGTSDSERIFLYLVDVINNAEDVALERKHHHLTFKERFKILDCQLSNMAKGNKLNFIMYDGEYMYVHTNYKDSLHYLKLDEGTVFSTAPITDDNWKKVHFTQLVAFKEGVEVARGTVHGNEYIETEDDLKFIYQNFAEL
jgi:glutamine amidotransferase